MKIREHVYAHSPWAKRKKTTFIILHCAATPEGRNVTVDEINAWHNARRFNGIGYHYIIYRDGTIVHGRDEDTVGAHTTGYNDCSIGVCYIGGCDKDGKTAKDTRTPEQKKAMLELVEHLMTKYKLPLDNVHCHYEFAAKACPSFKRETFVREYNEWHLKGDIEAAICISK